MPVQNVSCRCDGYTDEGDEREYDRDDDKLDILAGKDASKNVETQRAGDSLFRRTSVSLREDVINHGTGSSREGDVLTVKSGMLTESVA